MARARRVARGGPGYFGLIFFIVLSLLLIGAGAWMWTEIAKRSESLNALHKDIKRNLEDPLTSKIPGLHVEARATASDVAYSDSFFKKIGDSAADGVKYNALLEVTGYEGDDPVAGINDELQKTAPAEASLHSYVRTLERKLALAEEQLDLANNAFREASRAGDEAKAAQAQAEKFLAEERARGAKQLSEARRKYMAELGKMKRLVAQADSNKKKAYATLKVVEQGHKRELAQVKGQNERLTEQIETFQAERREKGEEKAALPTEGRVASCDLVEELVVINLGGREDVRTGDKFNVMHVGKGGVLSPKGEVQVIRVDELTSQADILQQDPDDPIMRGDIVRPQRQPGT